MVAGYLCLEPCFVQQPYPLRTREESAGMLIVLDPRRSIFLPQQVGVLNCVGRIGVVRVVRPFQIPQRAGVTIAAAVVGTRLKRLANMVRHKEGQPARSAVHKGRPQRQPKVTLGGHVIDGVVDEDHVKGTPESQRAHISQQVFTVTRVVRLTGTAVAALRAHQATQNEERTKAGSLWKDAGLMFTSTVGTPVDVGNLTYKSFRPLLERAGLRRIRFHDLRHTCATLLLSKGTHPKIVQEMLGHATISQTMDTYSHVLPDMQEKAVNAMESALS
jgi:hypothetical protein